jgi:2-oxo-4-hydroxy-4-carboxy-5-ureidoimidazoline decarboxylase
MLWFADAAPGGKGLPGSVEVAGGSDGVAGGLDGVAGGSNVVAGGLARLNAAATDEVERDLRACCASRAWVREVAGGRPYPDAAALLAASDAAFGRLAWPDLLEALAAHPRIGEPPTGSGREAGWSRSEQSGVDGAAGAVRAALADGNRAYEERFGHVFVICASGLTAERMRASIESRLTNQPAVERSVVRDELRKIAHLRLARMFAS